MYKRLLRLLIIISCFCYALTLVVSAAEINRSYTMDYYYRTADGVLLTMSQTSVRVDGNYYESIYSGNFEGSLSWSFPRSVMISGAGGNTAQDGIYAVSDLSLQNDYEGVFVPVVTERGQNTNAVVTWSDSLISCNISCMGAIQTYHYWSNWFADCFLNWATYNPSGAYGSPVGNNDAGATNMFRLIVTLDVSSTEILTKLDLTNEQLEQINIKLSQGNTTLDNALDELKKLTDDSALNPAVDDVEDLTNQLDGVKNDLQDKIDKTQDDTKSTQDLTINAIDVLLPGVKQVGNYITKSVSDSNNFEMETNDGFGLWTFVGVSVFLVIGFALFRKFQGEVH